MKKLQKYTIVVSLLLLCINTVEAKKLPGFIITEQNDTIQGEVLVHTFNRRTGAYVFSGIDLEWCYLNVSFRARGKKSFKYYLPEQLKAYHFTFEDQEYIFHSFRVQYKSMVKSERDKFQFLLLVNRNKKEAIYKAQSYVATSVNKTRIDLDYYHNLLVPEYNYYHHKIGDPFVIKYMDVR